MSALSRFQDWLMMRTKVRRLEAELRSVRASLDDANEIIKRLASEKASLNRVIQTIKENVGAY